MGRGNTNLQREIYRTYLIVYKVLILTSNIMDHSHPMHQDAYYIDYAHQSIR